MSDKLIPGTTKRDNNPYGNQGNVFSFKSGQSGIKLNIYPQITGETVLDVGFTKNKKNSFEDIIKDIPFIQIREYQPDTPIDQWINIFKEAYKQTKGILEEGKASMDVMKKFYANLRNSSTIETIIPDAAKIDGKADPIKSMANMLYRRLIGYETINRYELPFSGQVLYDSKGQSGWKSRSSNVFNSFLLLSNIKITYRPVWNMEESNGVGFEVEFNLYNDTAESAFNNFLFINNIIPNNMWMQYGIMQQSPCLYDVKISGGLRYFMCSANITCSYLGNIRTLGKINPNHNKISQGTEQLNNIAQQINEKRNEESGIQQEIDNINTEIENLRNQLQDFENVGDYDNTELIKQQISEKEEELNQKNTKLMECINEISELEGNQDDQIGELDQSIYGGQTENNFAMGEKKDNIRIPDVYNIKISFNSLIPTNFNTYLLDFASQDEIMKSGEYDNIDSIYKDLIDKIGELINSSAAEVAYDRDIGLSKAEEKINDINTTLKKEQTIKDELSTRSKEIDKKIKETDKKIKEIDEKIKELEKVGDKRGIKELNDEKELLKNDLSQLKQESSNVDLGISVQESKIEKLNQASKDAKNDFEEIKSEYNTKVLKYNEMSKKEKELENKNISNILKKETI